MSLNIQNRFPFIGARPNLYPVGPSSIVRPLPSFAPFTGSVQPIATGSSPATAAPVHGLLSGLKPGARADATELFARVSGAQPEVQRAVQKCFHQWLPTAAPAGIASDLDRIMHDATMSLEDKIAAVLFAIMRDFDQRLAKKLADVTNAANGTTAPGSSGGTAPANGASVDVEVEELKQMMQKRNDLFGTMSALINKLNETANQTIQSMSR